MGFIGGELNKDSSVYKIIIEMYDKKYLEGTNCHHYIRIVKRSENFAVSQIWVDCNSDKENK